MEVNGAALTARDTKEDVLYSYGNAKTNAEYIPAGGGSDIVEKTIDIMTLIGNTSNISATINQSLIFETPEGAQEKVDAAKEAAMVTINDLKTNLEKSLATHQADTMPHQFVTSDKKKYRYGFKTNTAKDGLTFVYEEVL
ncbi:hypothetical protein ACIQZM_18020 [Peribacillus sp. NPDC097206]|uniref:hypothetical protein n=1 Tax=unclassified Peribacillus TaxID=2675266 RepID=UPI003804D576